MIGHTQSSQTIDALLRRNIVYYPICSLCYTYMRMVIMFSLNVLYTSILKGCLPWYNIFLPSPSLQQFSEHINSMVNIFKMVRNFYFKHSLHFSSRFIASEYIEAWLSNCDVSNRGRQTILMDRWHNCINLSLFLYMLASLFTID